MPKGDFGDRMPISNQDSSRNALDYLSKLLIVCTIGAAVLLVADSLRAQGADAPPQATEHTEIMEEEEVEDLPEDSILQQTWSMLTSSDRGWLDSLIEGAIK